MDHATMEIEVIEEKKDLNDAAFRELNDFQLAYVGGGCADPIYH